MPPLHAQLTAHLDVSALVGTLRGDLGGLVATLQGLPPAVPPAQGQALGEGSVAADSTGLSATVGRIAQALGGLAEALPLPGGVLRELQAPLALLETLTAGDLEGEIRRLLDLFQNELARPGDSGFAAVLTRVSEILANSPEGASLGRVLSGLLASAGLDARGAGLPLRDLAGSLDAVVRLLGALMGLETELHEGERLSAILASRLDAGGLRARFDALLAGPLNRAALAQAAAGDEAALGAAERAALELDALLAATVEAMAFGEATLVYLDLARLRLDVESNAAAVLRIDLAPLSALLGWLAERLAPLLQFDLEGLPQLDFPGVLALLAERGAEALAATLEGADLTPLTGPLRQGIGRLAELTGSVTSGIAQAQLAVRSALAPLVSGVAAVPVGKLTAAVGVVLTPLATLLDQVRGAVAAIDAALGTVVGEAKGAIEGAERSVAAFEESIGAAFQAAADHLDQIGLDAQIGTLAGAIRDFAGRLAEADLQPVFDATAGAIDGAAQVIGAVPFDLLPDSMEQDVVTALRPLKEARPRDAQAEILHLLEEPPIEQVLTEQIAQVGDLFHELIAEVRKFDPHHLAATLDAELAGFAGQIRQLSPHAALEPIERAVAGLRAALAGLDLGSLLAPVDAAFARIEGAVESYGPAALVAPLEARLAAARTALVRLLRLDQAEARLDALVAQGKGLLAQVDPEVIEQRLTQILGEARGALEDLPLPTLGGLGALVAGFLAQTGAAGGGARVSPSSFNAVVGWFGAAEPGSGALRARAARIAAAVVQARDGVAALDPRDLQARLEVELAPLRTALPALPAGSPVRLRLEVVLPQAAAGELLSNLAVNRDRYLEVLGGAVAGSDLLQRLGLSEVDAAVERLRGSVAPLRAAAGRLRAMLARTGVPGLDGGLSGLVAGIFAAAPPERLAALATPLLRALHARIDRLLDELAAPLRQGLTDLRRAIDALDLAPLRAGLEAVQGEIVAQIAALSPRALLAPALASFTALQQQLAGFDPLAAIESLLDGLRDAVARLLERLDAEALLRGPIQIYERLLALLAGLDVDALLAPVVAQVDGLVTQVESGLEETIVAFEQLQAALPAQVGGTSLAASGSVDLHV